MKIKTMATILAERHKQRIEDIKKSNAANCIHWITGNQAKSKKKTTTETGGWKQWEDTKYRLHNRFAG